MKMASKEAEAWCSYVWGYVTNKRTGKFCDFGFCKDCGWRTDRIAKSGLMAEEED
jgi:hypothetical protein